MTIMFSVEETGLMDIYPGIYLKHDSNYHLHSGSVFIHRVPPNSARPLQVQTFEQGSTEIEHAVPKSIADFFTEKRFVYIKTPKRFSDDSLSEWLIKKKESRNEIKDIDLFVSATILSAKEKMDFLEEIKSAIGKTVLDYIKERSSAEVDQKSVEDLLKRIGEAQELDLTNQFPTEGVFADYRTFHAEVQNMIKGLAARVEEIDENRISFSFQDLPPTGFIHQEPKIVMERDFRLLKRSKGLLVICPFNRVFSSCWVLVSRSHYLGIPTFGISR
ncbi:MAG: hypothetical protein IPK21_15510 [Haliscomenobacter sp.]|nr:hypothetical protein [Haliscomenobacter sp.]